MASREIKIVIASPSDVIRERELLLHHVETKFRRDKYEELCKARIIVEGWEGIPSQPGYPQDIIDSTLIKSSDIVLAIFKHTLGTPIINSKTKEHRAVSGTAGELLYAIKKINRTKSQSAWHIFMQSRHHFHFFLLKKRKNGED